MAGPGASGGTVPGAVDRQMQSAWVWLDELWLCVGGLHDQGRVCGGSGNGSGYCHHSSTSARGRSRACNVCMCVQSAHAVSAHTVPSRPLAPVERNGATNKPA